jgi:uncharacterized damage-inducible protein DinB
MPTLTPDEIRAASRARSALDYAGTIRSVYPFWDAQYRPYLLMALDALPAERFGYKPAPEILTAHQILVHIAEAERAWHGIVEGKPVEDWVVERANPAEGYETKIDVPDHAALRALLAKWHEPTQACFNLPLSELGRIVHYTPPGMAPRTYTLHWILDHIQEHEIHHRAQLNLYLRMMEIAPPSI